MPSLYFVQDESWLSRRPRNLLQGTSKSGLQQKVSLTCSRLDGEHLGVPAEKVVFGYRDIL